ncbi:MAG: PIG-L family deacetylase [Deltaproteobacteria bacterium]|nr:PIG-L family deacetylase [Deltaproteobacteria bacterium]MBW2414276.1 PIG-L family deacetylase [Deltaproteobacteria bacterium]
MPRIPDLRQARRLLCVQPHYDDNDLGAGGTIAALAAAGAEVHYLTVTDDLVGVLDASLSDDEARARLHAEQEEAGAEIGVTSQTWLDYPDAGEYGYFELRTRIIRRIREVRPDFVLTVDPDLPYEAHRDHLVVGRAASESILMYRFARIATDPQVDRAYEPHEIRGLAYYFTARPNTVFDIDASRQVKHRAIGAYRSQFTPEGIDALRRGLEAQERRWAADEAFDHGEALLVLARSHLHVNLDSRV